MSIGILIIFGIGILSLILTIIFRYDEFEWFLIVGCIALCVGTSLFIVKTNIQEAIEQIPTICVDNDETEQSDELKVSE